MTQDITIRLPIYIPIGKKKITKFPLNLNAYRNAHYHILNSAKEKFEDIAAARIGHLPRMASVEVIYRLFFGSKRAIDISNICCIVDKFFCDTLVNRKKLIDDNMNVISKVTFEWGGVNAQDPYVEATLTNIQTIEDIKPMQILLTQQEIEDAIRETITQQIVVREDQGIAISFQQLKEAGLTAMITIQKMVDTEVAPKKVRTRRANQAEESQPEPAKATVVEREEVPPPADVPSLSQPIEAPKMPIFTQGSGGEAPVLSPAPKIFPDAHTSAPVQARELPAVSGKSLFANLTKPVHDAAPE